MSDENYLIYGAGLGVALGSGFGVTLGVLMDNIGLGIALGTGIGIALGVTGALIYKEYRTRNK